MFRIEGKRFSTQGLGFRVSGFKSNDKDLMFKVYCSGFRV